MSISRVVKRKERPTSVPNQISGFASDASMLDVDTQRTTGRSSPPGTGTHSMPMMASSVTRSAKTTSKNGPAAEDPIILELRGKWRQRV